MTSSTDPSPGLAGASSGELTGNPAPAVIEPAGLGDEDMCAIGCVDPVRAGRALLSLPPEAVTERAARLLRVLGDPTRLRIVRALASEELCVCDLATLMGQSQSTISHSLRALRQMRLVRYRRVGKIAYYSVDDAHVADISAFALEHVRE